jgi:hypothetical protein
LIFSSTSSAAWPGIFGDDVERARAEVGLRLPTRHSEGKPERLSPYAMHSFLRPNRALAELRAVEAVYEMQARCSRDLNA